MEKVKGFCMKYAGAIIGVIIALILLLTHLYKAIIAIILIFVCGYAGNYIQLNKDEVKDKLKNFIDKL